MTSVQNIQIDPDARLAWIDTATGTLHSSAQHLALERDILRRINEMPSGYSATERLDALVAF